MERVGRTRSEGSGIGGFKRERCLTAGFAGGIFALRVGVAAVRSSVVTALVRTLIHCRLRWFLRLAGLRSRSAESATGKEDSDSEDVGELHLGWDGWS